MNLKFLGATGTVAGSKYMLEDGGKKFLIDCRLFQSLKELRLRNWERLPVDPVIEAPAQIQEADYLVLEFTHGDRLHDITDPLDQLEGIISKTIARGGTVVIPAFAVGRAQSLIYYIHELKSTGRIPDIPVYLDSPMSIIKKFSHG